ncbi:MAG: DUF5805 domain-containing protein [Natronomonas sp.]
MSERVSVQTYVSSSQRAVWQEEAEEMGMTQAEYVRTMVQAGRRSFDLTGEKTRSTDATPGVDDRKGRVLECLSREEYTEWDELREELVGDIEAELDTTLEELQSEGAVSYSGRHGGYRVVE